MLNNETQSGTDTLQLQFVEEEGSGAALYINISAHYIGEHILCHKWLVNVLHRAFNHDNGLNFYPKPSQKPFFIHPHAI